MRLVVGILVAAVVGTAGMADAQRPRRRPDAPSEQPTTPPSGDAGSTAASDQARALFVEGQRLYTEGEYDQAVAKWREAYALHPAPALHYNLAQAYGRLGDLQNELESLRAYVAGVGADEPNAVLARARITALENRLLRTGLSFTGLAADAELRIDGEVVPVPAEGELVSRPPGSHDIAVRRRGHLPFESRVEVLQGRTLAVAVTQEPLAEVRKPVVGYVLMAAGGAAIGTALATGLIAFRRSPDSFTGTDEGVRLHRLAVSTDVVASIGAAAAATGLVLFILRDRPESDGFEDTAVRFVPYVAAGSGGVLLDGRF